MKLQRIASGKDGQSPHISKLIRIFLISLTLLTSCGSPPIKTIEVTRVVPQTIVVTKIIEVVVTATPQPATSTIFPPFTPEFTSAPAPTTPSSFLVWDTQQVVDAFLAAGLDVSNPRPMTVDDFGFVPMLSVKGTRFFIPSICADCGGRIMSFASEEDIKIVSDYYAQLGRISDIFYSWVFTKDNILVQINGEVPEAIAMQYQAVLNALK